MSIEIVKDYMFFLFFFGWGNWNKNVGGVVDLWKIWGICGKMDGKRKKEYVRHRLL